MFIKSQTFKCWNHLFEKKCTKCKKLSGAVRDVLSYAHCTSEASLKLEAKTKRECEIFVQNWFVVQINEMMME